MAEITINNVSKVYPDGFHAGTIGCTRPAESVARDTIV